MFSQIIIFATVALSVATGAVANSRESSFTCNAGALQCCNQLEQAGSQNANKILAGAGIAAQGISGLVGAQCSPLTAGGTGSGVDCVTQPICCEKNQLRGGVAIGCAPATIKA